MRKIKYLLVIFITVTASLTVSGQSNPSLYVDFGMIGFSSSASSINLNKNQDYQFDNLCQNVCTNNTYTWYFTRTDGAIPTGITINGQANNYTFGNGGNNIGRPSVRFSLPGIYNVRLKVQRANPQAAGEQCSSQTGEKSKQGYIIVPYSIPVAAFNSNGSASNKTINAGTAINFTDATSNSPTTWEWSISPSAGWAYISGNAGSQNPTVNFTTVGNYSISLKATNPGNSNTITKSSHISVIPTRPVVDFSANGSVAAGIAVLQNMSTNFNDLSLYDPTSWTWTISPGTGRSFVGGTTANSKNPLVNFTNIGPYTVTLTAANAGGSAAKSKANNIIVYPPPPTITNEIVKYCVGAAAIPLQATGTALKWYTVSVGGTASAIAPTPSTATAGVTNYYVTQTIAGYESSRSKANVVINPLPEKPIVSPLVTECIGAIAPALTATGTSLKWYTVGSGGSSSTNAPIPVTITAGTFLNYVSQTDSKGCEGQRSMITVNIISTLPAPTTISPVAYCLDGPAVPLIANKTVGTGLQWFDVPSGGTALAEAPIPLTTNSGSKNYYVAQTKLGCAVGTYANIVVNVNSIPTPDIPSFTTPVVYTQGQDAIPLTATGTGLKWYAVGSGGTALPFTPLPQTGLVGTVPYFVTQTINGCESARGELDVLTDPGVPVPPPAWENALGISAFGVSSFSRTLISSEEGVLAAGGLSGQVFFGKNIAGQDISLNNNGGECYLVKYNTNNKVLWAIKTGIATPSSSMSISGISKAPNGGTYITGIFYGGFNFGGTNLVTNNAFQSDIFIARIDANGQFVWAKKAGNAIEQDYSNAIVSNIYGDFYITGLTSGSAIFGSVNLTVAVNGFFLAKYDKMGNAIWAKSNSPSLGSNIAGRSISLGANSAILIVDGQNLNWYDGNGNFLKTYAYVSEGSTASPNLYQVTSDISGNIFVSGSFHGLVRFDSSITLSVDRLLSQPSKSAGFLMKFDNSGKLLWVRKAGGNIGRDIALNVITDDYGNAYLSGYFSETATFGSQTLISNGGKDGFLIKYGPQGNELWGRKVSGLSNEDVGEISIDGLGNIYVSGFGNGINFEGLTQPNINGRFIAKIGSTLPTPAIYEVFPNPVAPGSKINIIGKGLINTNEINLTGIIFDNYTVISSSQIEAFLPFEATTGQITLSTPLGTCVDSVILVVKENIYNDDKLPPAKFNYARLTTRPWISSYNVKTAADIAGNVYVGSNYYRQIDLVDTILSAVEIPNINSIYLSKYNANGTFKWAITSGGSGLATLEAIETDLYGNVFLTGFISSSNDEVFTLDSTTLQGGGQFIAKINSNGNLQWLKKIDGQSLGGYGLKIKIDKFGNLLMSGTFTGTKNFGSLQLTSTGVSGDYYWVKFNPNGEVSWGKQKPIGEGGGVGIATDYEGNILCYYTAGYLHKFATDGSEIWKKQTIGGQMSFDKNNNIYISGYFNYNDTPLDFGTVVLRSNSSNSGFLSKLNKDGNILWARKYFDTEYSLSGTTYSNDIVVDSIGNVYLLGVFDERLLFSNDTLDASSGKENIWMAKFDYTGKKVWATSLKQISYQSKSYPNRIYVKGNDELTITGFISNGTIKFGDSTLTAIGDDGNSDPYFPFNAPFMTTMGGPPPAISEFYITQGNVGDTVTIDGLNFIDAKEVRFNGTVTPNYTVLSARKILAVVPDSAATGTIMVTTPNGTAKATSEFLITGQNSGMVELCPGSTSLITSSILSNPCQWQVDMGNGFIDISDIDLYADFTTTTMKIKDANSSMYGFKYRCLVNGQISDTLSLRFVSTWTGAANDNWDDLGNWGCSNRIPDINTDVFIPSGTVVIRSNVLVRSLHISPGANVKVEEGFTFDVINQ